MDAKQLGVLPLDSVAGATDDDKLTAALALQAASPLKPTIVLSARSHTFAKTYPLQNGMRLSGPLGGYEREFGAQCVVHVTGAALFSVQATGAKDISIQGLCFNGTGTNTWCAPTADLAKGPIIQDMNIRAVGWNAFASVMQARHLRCSIERTYCNNGAGTQFYLSGSDNYYWLEGDSYISGHALKATDYYIRFGFMSKTQVGPIYITPEVATGMRIDGGYGGLHVRGARFDSSGRSQTTACQGPAMLVTGGSVSVESCDFLGNAVATGAKGQLVFTGGENHSAINNQFMGSGSLTPSAVPGIYTTVPVYAAGNLAVQGGNGAMFGPTVATTQQRSSIMTNPTPNPAPVVTGWQAFLAALKGGGWVSVLTALVTIASSYGLLSATQGTVLGNAAAAVASALTAIVAVVHNFQHAKAIKAAGLTK